MHEVRENSVAYVVAPSDDPAANARPVRLFRNGANQAVRIPKEFELPGNEARMYRDGDRLVIEAVKPELKAGSPAAMLAMLDRWAAEFPEGIDEDPWADIDKGLLPLDTIDLSDPETPAP